MSKHTLSIFRYMLANIPPHFPLDICEKMKNSVEQLENDPRVTAKMVEDSMIKFGYDLWPWNEAYREFFGLNEGKLGEQFFLSHLRPDLGAHYLKYKDYGLSWRDLYTGRAAKYFDDHERQELSRALVETRTDLLRFTDRELAGIGADKYIARVEEYRKILDNIKQLLGQMRSMADAEQYHPILADEIRDRARCFELGLCLLGPNCNLDEVMRSIEFYFDRKMHLNMMRGIDKPADVDIYNS